MLEIIVVIFIFLTAIVGAYSVIQNFYASTIYSTNRLTALYLSQEGIELVKNIRDFNLVNEALDWKNNIISGIATCSNGIICKIDFNDLSLSSDTSPYTYLRKDSETGFYNYDSGAIANFKRKIIITSNASPDYINVSAETEWYRNGVKAGSVKIEDNLYGYWK